MEYTSTSTMTREEWLEARKSGIGGSDCAAIMGATKWATPLSVYMDKLGEAPEKEMNEAMVQGVLFEDIVAKRFSEESGYKVQRCLKMFRHPEYPWMLANIDRQVMGLGEFVGLECKTTSVYNKTDFENGDVQPNYWWQCQHYMAVTGAKKWYLAVMVLSQSFHIFDIPRDEDAIDMLIAKERTFWEENVMKKIRPLPVGTEADDEAISYIEATEDEDEEISLDDFRNTLDELELVKADYDRIKARKDELEQIVKVGIGEYVRGATGSWSVTYRPQTKTSVDSKRLKAEMPEIYKKYSKESTSRVLRVKKIEEE